MYKYEHMESSLNEIDVEMGNILLKMMRIADTRTLTELSQTPLWDETRILQVDDLSTEEIFNSYLQRVSGDASKKEVDITYPLLGYKANDIDEVFYGTGNRVRQWEFENPLQGKAIEVDEEVLIAHGELRGNFGKYVKDIDGQTCVINVSGTDQTIKYADIRRASASTTNVFKAKQIQTTYDVGILVEPRKEARYLMDKFILRCADGHIWHPYISKVAGGAEFHIFTVFGIPNVDKYPTSSDKLKGSGYIYGITFQVQVWAWLADGPVPEGFIEQIKLNMDYEGYNTKPDKISITA